MLFNTIDFAIFLPTVFIIYWFLLKENLKLQNLFIVIASYFFYGWWDWRFLSLIFFSTIVDYYIGVGLIKSNSTLTRKFLLFISLTVNIGFLGFFKYYNFFLDNFITAFEFFGYQINSQGLNVVLPVGISFYTFQTLSYSIDIYRRKLMPTKDFIAFSAFVSFFPQLVAGPIERATHLLPQFYESRKFSYAKAVDGLRQILWGLFKKIVIADNAALIANKVFENSSEYGGSTLILGALAFTFQIYCDFSGYSDIAIGTSKLFGFELMKNFAFPYFSRDIAEFWRRWHISLSTWFRDYLYIPLGGSKVNIYKKIRNIFIIFIVSGFWHGANWTFLIWGALNAIYFLPLMILNKNRVNTNVIAQGRYLPTFIEFMNMTLTFILTVFAWIIFRSTNINQAIQFISTIFSKSLFSTPKLFIEEKQALITSLLIIAFMLIEWIGRENQYAIEKLGLKWNNYLRYSFYYLIISLIFIFGGEKQQFIYFQF